MKVKRTEPSQELLREMFDYDPQTGRLMRRILRTNAKRGLSSKANGYFVVRIANQQWYVHRLIWVFVNGPIPREMQIDHINRDRSDNRIFNLRLATASQQMGNAVGWSGLRGISVEARPRYKKGRYRVKIGGRDIGRFDSLEDAKHAYAAAFNQRFGVEFQPVRED